MSGLKGVDALKRRLDAVGRSILLPAAGTALSEEANNIIAEAIPLTPLDLGALRGSAYVTLPEVSGSQVTVEVGYGGNAAAYAAELHEVPKQNYSEPGTGTKYLERPFNAARAGMAGRISARVATLLARRGGVATPRGGPYPTSPGGGGKG